MISSIYKFEYQPVWKQPMIIRYINLDQIMAVGMFVEGELIDIQIDCKHRDAPLVIEISTQPELLSMETEKVKAAVDKLVSSWEQHCNVCFIDKEGNFHFGHPEDSYQRSSVV